MTEFSDELLMAYIDGQLDKPQAAVVGRFSAQDEAVARRLQRLQDSQAKFLDLFGGLVRDGAAAAPARRREPAAGRGFQISAADITSALTGTVAGLLLVLGASVGFTTAYYSGITAEPGGVDMQMTAVSWNQDIAELHAFFNAETLASGRDSQTNPEAVKFQLAKLGAQPAVLPDFSPHGLRFVRAQTLSYQRGKLIQLIYSGKSDPLVAVYVTPGDADAALTPGHFGDVRTVSWSEKGLRFLIAGDMTQEQLRALAAVLQAQLGKG